MKKYILLLFLGITGTLHAQNQTVILSVPHVNVYSNFYSIRTKWCAPACAECVLKYNNININQCDIMDYIRLNFGLYGGPSGFGCCSPDPPNQAHPCDQGVDLGFNDETVSIKNLLKHFGNGNILAYTTTDNLSTDNIKTQLQQGQPLIAQWDYHDVWKGAHTVVVFGIERVGNVDRIHFMNPDLAFDDWYPYDAFVSNGDFRWVGSLCTDKYCSSRGDLCPCHCLNGEFEPWLGETGLDCGGDCPDCGGDPPPPTGNCSDCIKNRDEKEIDCGGYFCPPCQDLPEEKVIENEIFASNNIIYGEVMATKKITAKGNTRVVSGAKARFITEDGGSIVLLPGFKAENGSNFSTQMKDLSAYSRICPDSICLTASFAAEISKYGYIYFSIEDLLYAVKIELEAYDEQGLIYSDIKKVTRNGSFYYGIPIINQDTYTYLLDCIVYYCNGDRHRCKFRLSSSYGHHKSLNEGFEKTDTLLHFSPSHIETTVFSTATSAPKFSIIPNPNSGTFQLETNFSLSEIGNLKITNPLGITVYQTQNILEHTIQLQNLAPGMFFVVIILKDSNVLTQKMMVQ